MLQSEWEAVDRAHIPAIETFEAECLRLNDEVSSLQAALGESRSPRRWTEGDVPRELKVDFLTRYLGTREAQVTCHRINGYYMCHGYSQLREQLLADDPHLNPTSFRYFPHERMLKDGRTLLRFPKPPTGGFTVYLLGDTLPVDPSDRVDALFPLYRSAAHVEGEVSDSEAGPSVPSSLPPAFGSPDLTTRRT